MVQGESLMIDYKKVIKNRELRLKLISFLSFVPDELYIKIVYKIKTGKRLNLKNPQTFNEKLNWLKLHGKREEYTDLADKLKAREYISKTLSPDYLFPLLGVWDSFEEIDFDALPESFALKCNHDSGSVKLIADKTKADKKALSKFFKGRLSINPYYLGREYPYKNIKPKIIAEEFMKSSDGKGIRDYKYFCFNGEPRLMFVASDREADVKFDFFDMDFNHLDIYNIHPNAEIVPERPQSFEKMKELCRILTKGMPFVRLDLYEIDSRVYFGEFTFFHGGGFYEFFPDEWNKKLGDLIDISGVKD